MADTKTELPASSLVPAEKKSQEQHRKKRPSGRRQLKWRPPVPSLWSIVLAVVILVSGGMLARHHYQAVRDETYNCFYQTAFDLAEQQNHVSNEIAISVTSAKEVSRLEVLRAGDSVYLAKNADETDDMISWVEVQGEGVFTTDLSAAEFICDSPRQHVLVKAPVPILSEFRISDSRTLFLKKDKQFQFPFWFPFIGKPTFRNGSVQAGMNLAMDQRNEAYVQLEDSMKQNRYFHESAKDSAVRAIELLVKQWNPDLPDLQVDVEFYSPD